MKKSDCVTSVLSMHSNPGVFKQCTCIRCILYKMLISRHFHYAHSQIVVSNTPLSLMQCFFTHYKELYTTVDNNHVYAMLWKSEILCPICLPQQHPPKWSMEVLFIIIIITHTLLIVMLCPCGNSIGYASLISDARYFCNGNFLIHV